LPQKIGIILKGSAIVLYICLITLWFQGNIPSLKEIDIDYRIPLIGLLLISSVRLFYWMRSNKSSIKFKRNIKHKFAPTFTAALILILIALAAHLPYLINAFGTTDSDDAIPALMGKHISEGRVPPLYFYGQLYLGSLSAHIYALMISIFGYSFYLIKSTAFLFYLAFLVVQFCFLKDLFSSAFAWMVSIFWCLPIGYTAMISLNCSRADSLVFLLGISIIFLAYLIYHKDRDKLLPTLGFLMGIAFWTHQITVFYIVTAFLVVFMKYRMRIRKYIHKYLTLMLYFAVGVFPVVITETFLGFPLSRYLLGGEAGTVESGKISRAVYLSLGLIAPEDSPLKYVFLALIVFGFFFLIFLSLKQKKFSSASIYSLFFLVFFFIYLLSGFSRLNLSRYLFPLYFCLPVLMLSAFLIIRSKMKYFLMGLTIILLFVLFNMKTAHTGYLATSKAHNHRRQIIAFMKETGHQYWRGGFWTSYMISALAGEEPMVDSIGVNRYYPYRIRYDSESTHENYIFMDSASIKDPRQARQLTALLDAFGIDYKYREIDDSRFIYGVENPIHPFLLGAPIPDRFPAIEILQTEVANGYFYLIFRNKGAKDNYGGYRIHLEIPGYSSVVRFFPLHTEATRIRIPMPEQESFTIRYFLDYRGLIIESSRGELVYSRQPADEFEKRRIVFLSGVGPNTDFEGKELKICDKTVEIKINASPDRLSKVRAWLYSPFDFDDIKWYGTYHQAVRIELNGRNLTTERLAQGGNALEFPLDRSFMTGRSNILKLEFKYAMFSQDIPVWKTAALLGNIAIE
jgi:hypothetical protein